MKILKYFLFTLTFLTYIQVLYPQNNNNPWQIAVLSIENSELWWGQLESSIISFEVRDSLGNPISGKVVVRFKIVWSINSSDEYLSPASDTTDEQGRVQTVIHTGSLNISNVVQVQASIDNTIIKSSPLPIYIHTKPTQVARSKDLSLKDFELNQNYPNPFNPLTTISYSVPIKSNISLEVLNILGERIALLDEGEKEIGINTVQWNANISSGIYYFRLNTIKGSFVRKILLIK